MCLAQIKVPVCVYAFDCLFVDGASLLRKPLSERRAALLAAFPNLRPGYFSLAHSWELRAPDEAPIGEGGAEDEPVGVDGEGAAQGAKSGAPPAKKARKGSGRRPARSSRVQAEQKAAAEKAALAAEPDQPELPAEPPQKQPQLEAAAAELDTCREPEGAAAAGCDMPEEGAAADAEQGWTDASVEAAIREHLQVRPYMSCGISLFGTPVHVTSHMAPSSNVNHYGQER